MGKICTQVTNGRLFAMFNIAKWLISFRLDYTRFTINKQDKKKKIPAEKMDKGHKRLFIKKEAPKAMSI